MRKETSLSSYPSSRKHFHFFLGFTVFFGPRRCLSFPRIAPAAAAPAAAALFRVFLLGQEQNSLRPAVNDQKLAPLANFLSGVLATTPGRTPPPAPPPHPTPNPPRPTGCPTNTRLRVYPRSPGKNSIYETFRRSRGNAPYHLLLFCEGARTHSYKQRRPS